MTCLNFLHQTNWLGTDSLNFSYITLSTIMWSAHWKFSYIVIKALFHQSLINHLYSCTWIYLNCWHTLALNFGILDSISGKIDCEKGKIRKKSKNVIVKKSSGFMLTSFFSKLIRLKASRKTEQKKEIGRLEYV